MGTIRKRTRQIVITACLMLAILALGHTSVSAAGISSGDAYILGRPMTDEEIAQQKAMEPKLSTTIPDNLTAPSLEQTIAANRISSDQLASALTSTSLPDQYDSSVLNQITPVRDQGNWGTCWSFAAIAQAEASLVSKGVRINHTVATASNLDLSERQLAYFFYHTKADPLGNTTGDSTTNLYSDYLNLGGNSVFTTFALAKWVGAAQEEKAPYIGSGSVPDLNNSLSYDDAAHLENAYWINLKDKDDVKAMIKQYGAVAIAYYHDSTYYNYNACSYYQNATTATNHAVTVVGWDDNYDASNFNRNPGTNGAWLVKNSWSTGWGDDGYFWLSYADTSLTASNSKAFVFDFDSSEKYDHNYQYDGSFGIGYNYVYNGGSIANVFTAKGNPTGADESLDAVSFALYDVNVNYSIQVYKNPSNATDPTSGTKMLSSPVTGTTSYVGYYTIPLSSSITVAKGDTFSIVITLSSNSNSYVYYFADSTYQNGNWIKFVNATSSGQSFAKNASTSSWLDLNTNNTTARIKAFTHDLTTTTTKKVNSITLNQSNATIDLNTSSQTLSLTASIVPADAANQTISWSSTNPSVATVSNGIVTGLNAGTTTIQAISSDNPAVTASCNITVKEKNIYVTTLYIETGTYTINLNDQLSIPAKTKPTNATNPTLYYASSNTSILTVNQSGVVKAVGVGKAKITAITKDGSNLVAASTILVKPVKVSGFKASSQNTTSIKLTWSKQKNVDGYELYRYDTKKKNYTKIATKTGDNATSYTDTKRNVATEYQYKVRTYKTIDGKKLYGSYSSILKASTTSKAPALNVKAGAKKAILTWKKVDSVSGYEVVMSTKQSSDYSIIKTLTSSKKITYTKSGLKKGKIYYFKIRTYKTVNGVKLYSAYSSVKKVKITQ